MIKPCEVPVQYTPKEEPYKRYNDTCSLSLWSKEFKSDGPNIWKGSAAHGTYMITINQKNRFEEIKPDDIVIEKVKSEPDYAFSPNKETIAKFFNDFLDNLYG
jgi:hypothetical protein